MNIGIKSYCVPKGKLRKSDLIYLAEDYSGHIEYICKIKAETGGHFLGMPCKVFYKDILIAYRLKKGAKASYFMGKDNLEEYYIRNDNSPVSDSEIAKIKMLGLNK